MAQAFLPYSTIAVDDSAAPVVRITLNQPAKRNPISLLSAGELCHALAVVGARTDLVCVVLTGAGKAFSAGGDLSQMGGAEKSGGAVTPASFVELFDAMHGLGKPIIAMVNGHALAGGLGLMVACDLVVASDTATFGTTEINLALWPMMITAEITRNIGRKATLELMLTGKRVDAHEAKRMGLINQVCSADELEAVTMELATQLANKSANTLRLGLRAFYETQDMDYKPALEYLHGELAKVLTSEDALKAITAFLAR